jgi:hypothetical protein
MRVRPINEPFRTRLTDLAGLQDWMHTVRCLDRPLYEGNRAALGFSIERSTSLPPEAFDELLHHPTTR